MGAIDDVRAAHQLTSGRDGYAVVWDAAGQVSLVGYTRLPTAAVAAAQDLNTRIQGGGFRACHGDQAPPPGVTPRPTVRRSPEGTGGRPRWDQMGPEAFGHPPAPAATLLPVPDPCGTADLLDELAS